MPQKQNQSQNHSSGSAHRDRGRKSNGRDDRKGGRENSKRADEKFGPGSGPSTSRAEGGQYNHQRDPHYTSVARPQRGDYARLRSVMENPALDVGFAPLHGEINVDHSATDAAGHSSGSSSFDALTASQTHGTPPHLSSYDYSGAYHAIGSVRADGQVHDSSEVFEEYRHGNMDEEFDDNDDSDECNVESNVPS